MYVVSHDAPFESKAKRSHTVFVWYGMHVLVTNCILCAALDDELNGS